MDFLFRIPLFGFDIYSDSERKKNWKTILKAIKYSSPDLFREISRKNFENLSYSIRLKVFKYLIRGRYRSTPFGLLAATGIGFINDNNHHILNLRNRKYLKTSFSKSSPSPIWLMAMKGKERFGKVNFLTYFPGEERWVFVDIPKNPILELLENHFNQSSGLQFPEFQSWFEMPEKGYIETLWNHLTKMGILYQLPGFHQESQKNKPSVDTVLIDPLELPPSVKEEFQKFFNEAGNLFSKFSNPYLSSFEDWFQVEFDDRFVPLPVLLQYREFWESHFLSNSKNSIENPICSHLISQETIDLKKDTELMPIPEGIFDLGLLFRKLDGGQILIENIVCNKPFSYIGRFNRDNRIYSYQLTQKEEIYTEKDCLYAELNFYENCTINGICDTEDLFELKINPFKCPNSINLEHLELGIRKGEFILIHRTLKKRVIPIVTHPLNGKEISHPLLRLLWEICLEPGYKLKLYQESLLPEIPYLPEIKWGNIILQPKRWVLHRSQFASKSILIQWLEMNSIPETLSIGIYDRELVIRWKESMDLDIFWEELSKSKRITLKEALWLKYPHYFSDNGCAVFPQFVFHLSRAKKETPWNGLINSVEFEDSDCIYLLIKIHGDELEDFLSFYFNQKLTSFLFEQNIVWYYLIYPEKEFLQIRIRFLHVRGPLNSQLNEFVIQQLIQEKIYFKLKPYFPEVRKYGKTGYKISEQLFWMESSISIIWGRKSKEKDCEPHLKLLEIVLFWEEIILGHWSVLEMFEILKNKVKSLPYPEKSGLSPETSFIKTSSHKPYFPNEWVKSYSKLINQLLKGISSNQEKWKVLNHHLHMQMNRFFLLERDQFEIHFYRQLYKRMGRILFLKDS